MSLKDYQRRIIDEVDRYLRALVEERSSGNTRYASMGAWERVGLSGYTREQNGLGEDLPRFCIKVPTGGGKTLLATQILGSILQTVHADRAGAGLVLWVVPSGQIYRDTLAALRDRGGFLRTMLEHSASRRIEIWEKTDVMRMTPAQLRECLNILIVQLASTNRATREQLKFFQDSGGNITMHFPPEDEPEAHKALKDEIPNLEMIEDDEATGRHLVKTSVGNLVRKCRPAVILDEGHRATSRLAQDTLREFNASVMVELSATPRGDTNVLARASGQELLDEEMIKLPLNIAISGAREMADVLTRARDKREALAAAATRLVESGERERLIRPIVLVQVERTGRDQRGGGHIHALDVKEHLMQRLGVPEQAIAIKSSDSDDIEGIDLMDSDCPICWIITKSALQEGWDCPFAYILASLDNTGSERAMTQLIGRVLRQPDQERTPDESLNQAYVYCLRATAGEVSRQVKRALEKEGYEGDLAAEMVSTDDGDDRPTRKTAMVRTEFAELYRKPFEGKIYLPHFCVRERESVAPLDYFRHLISQVDVEAFEYDGIDWKLDDVLAEAKDRFYSVTLGADLERLYDKDVELLERDRQVLAWLVASLPFDFLSYKQLRIIVQRVYERLCASELELENRFGLVTFAVRERLERFIKEQVDKQTQAAFERIFEEDRLCFYLECAECRFEVPPSIELRSQRGLSHDDGSEITKSLFDYVDDESHNKYERAIALCLDRQSDVLWWYRNLVGPENFAIQGYRRHRIRPDFVVKRDDVSGPVHDVLVLESKGEHLEGNPDTTYKRAVASYFEKVGKRVPWQRLGEDFHDHQFRFQILDEASEHGSVWRDRLMELLRGSSD